MTKPKRYTDKPLCLDGCEKFDNGLVYEHWTDTINHEHHMHLQDGMLITFKYKTSEGNVEISKAY